MKVEDLFNQMCKGDPYATKAIPKGILCRDQYGTKVTYRDNVKTLAFNFGGDAEDEDAVLFATVLSAEAPIQLYHSGDEYTIKIPNITSEKAAEIVKKFFEV